MIHTSNEILEKISNAKHIVVISHVNPDADSIGSASAMYSFLLQKHKKVSWFCKTKDMDWTLSFIPWFEKIKNSFSKSADLAISLDCADKKRIGIEIECDLINIDHHITNNMFADINFVDSSAISTTKVLFDFFKKNGIKINKKMATALYAGLLDDSDGFLSQSVDGTTFATAKELIELEADYKLCNKRIMKSKSLASLRLKALMLKSMELEFNARVAVFCVTDDDMKSSGALDWDCEDALDESLSLAHVEIALLLKQNSDLSIKGSIRSSGIDILGIVTKFGGGGHKSRAGFICKEVISMHNMKDSVLNLIKEEL